MITPKEQKKTHLLLTNQFNDAYHDYARGLNTRAQYKLRNTATSEDLVQATFMKTWLYLVRGGKVDVMRAFLYHILNGLIVDEYRKRKLLSLDTLMEKGFDIGTTEFEQYLDIDDGKNAIRLIALLPIKYQHIMRMRYLEDLSLSEMSVITGKTKNTMAVQAHRGLEKLKSIYSAQISNFHV